MMSWLLCAFMSVCLYDVAGVVDVADVVAVVVVCVAIDDVL